MTALLGEAKPTKGILCWWWQLDGLGTKHAQTNSPTTDATTHWQISLSLAYAACEVLLRCNIFSSRAQHAQTCPAATHGAAGDSLKLSLLKCLLTSTSVRIVHVPLRHFRPSTCHSTAAAAAFVEYCIHQVVSDLICDPQL